MEACGQQARWSSQATGASRAAIRHVLLASLVLPLACGETPNPRPDDSSAADATSAPDSAATVDAQGAFDADPAGDILAPAPKLIIVPPTLHFGAVPPGTHATRSFKIFNQGDAPLKIHSVQVSTLSKIKTVTVTHTGPFEIAAKQSQLVDVELAVITPLPSDGAPVALLVVTSNDPEMKDVTLPLFAKSDTGSLKVTPPDVLDFVAVALGSSVDRKVSLFNQGTALVTVEAVTLADDSGGEFTLLPGTFPPVSNLPKAHGMNAAEYQSFHVRFTPKGTVGKLAKGKLRIKSDDPDMPNRTLVLTAIRAEGPKCHVKLSPDVLDFGVLAYGDTKTLALTVKNVGTGMCVLVDQKLLNCPAAGATWGAPTCTPIGTGPFVNFAPGAALFNLGPGASSQVHVLFNAPSGDGLVADPKVLALHFGFLGLRFKDQANGLTTWLPKDPTQGAAKLSPNLKASVGQTSTLVEPNIVDFGEVRVGCKSEAEQVKVSNTGLVPLFVTRLELLGCGGEVAKVGWPAVPSKGLEVTPTSSVSLGLRYAPQNLGKDTCHGVVTTGTNGKCVDAQGTPTASGPCKVTADCAGPKDALCAGQTFVTALVGQGTFDNERTDEFTGGPGKQVDVLLVVDNSPGMAAAQAKLAASLPQLMQLASQWQVDYHVGVVTTDMTSATDKGRLRTLGQTRVVTQKTVDATGTLQSLAVVGASGSTVEQGLAAAKAALSLPHTFDSQKACLQDTDCTDGACVAGPDGKKACGGHNRGFLRKDASLEIVFVSDDDDASPADVAYYVNALFSIKGAANKDLLHVHALVPSGGACGPKPGSRYIAVAKDTGGKVASVCDASFAAALKGIGELAFTHKHHYALSMTPQPATLSVSVGGKPCTAGPTGWFYEGKSNRVVLVSKSLGGTCVPAKGDKVSVHYKVLCLP